MEKEVYKYLSDVKIPVSKKYLENLILSHPNYPSIISIADALDRLGIDYAIGRKQLDELKEISFPFLVHTEPSSIKYIKSEAEFQITKNEYHLSGIVIKIEKTDTLKDLVHNKFLVNERITTYSGTIALLSAVLILILPPMLNLSIFSALLLISSLSGILIITLLKMKEFGIAHKKIDDFCKGGVNLDCESVITSDGSRIFNLFKLTDLAFSYFGVQLVSLAIVSQAPSLGNPIFSFVVLLAILQSPVIIYSVYYQWKVVGKWCRLCVLVSLVNLGQLILLLAYNGTIYNVISASPAYVHVALLLLFIFLTCTLTYLTNSLERLNSLEESDIFQKRVFNSPQVFFSMLEKEPHAHPKNSDLDMEVGDPNAAITITLVLSLVCNPCKKAFEHLLELMESHSKKVKAIIRLTSMPAGNGVFTADQYLIQFWMENIRGSMNESAQILELIKIWYRHMNLEEFETYYKLQTTELLPSVKQLINENKLWMESNNVVQTPTYFFNDRRMPVSYRLRELVNSVGFILEEIQSRQDHVETQRQT